MDQPTGPVTDPVVPPASGQPTWNDSMSQLDTYADRLRTQLPLAPPALLDGYMRWAPWVAIVFGLLGVCFSIAAVFLSAIFGGFLLIFGYYSGSLGAAAVIGSLVALLSSVLELIGGIQMLKRSAIGWWLLAFGMVVSLLTSLVHGSILTLIFILAVAYVHLQVKPNYR